MNLIIIDTGQKEFLENCLESLAKTGNFKTKVVREKESREATLNSILSEYGREDLLVFGDDIIFTKNWFEVLSRNREKGDIIGFSMLYPETETIQDQGYDLVKIDEEISLEPKERGKNKNEVARFDFRECDSLNGCALFIKKRVIEKVPVFPLEGMNRWGEFLFIQRAKKQGFKTIVLDHYLYHYGKGTKNNPNKLLSSQSYLLEKELWQNIVNKYIDKSQIKIQLERVLSGELENTLKGGEKILFYGAGTISELIHQKLKAILDQKIIDFCSGLLEEGGKDFLGKRIKYYKDVNFSDYDIVLITVLGKEKEILNLIKDYLKKQKIYYISQKIKNNSIMFNINTML